MRTTLYKKGLIFLLIILANLTSLSLSVYADPSEFVGSTQVLSVSQMKPTTIEVNGKKYTATSGHDITEVSQDGKVVTYTVSADGKNYQGSDGTTITKNADGSWSDPSFDRAVAGGLPTSTGAGGSTVVIVSEKVPGADCICIANEKSSDGKTCIGAVETHKYQCIVKPGLSGFQNIFAEIVRVIIYLVMLLGVLAIVGLGIAWAWAGGDDIKMKSNLKHWGINIAIGLILLFLFRYILTFLAPWIFM